MRTYFLIVLSVFLLAGGCAKKAAQTQPGPQATVALRDGTSFSGTVIKSSPSQITLTSATTGESRTYPMTQVNAVQYGPAASFSAYARGNARGRNIPHACVRATTRTDTSTPPRLRYSAPFRPAGPWLSATTNRSIPKTPHRVRLTPP